MLALFWIPLVFCLGGSDANTGSRMRRHCEKGFCISLRDGVLRAEAGLCVVIPCSFSESSYDFIPYYMIWYQCEQTKTKCADSDMIFHSNKNSQKPRSEFSGRASLLQPHVYEGNCSLRIADLRASDSGSYQFRLNGYTNGKPDGFTFAQRTTLVVEGLTQRPTLKVPPLLDGQDATLTCTAPGRCSGPDPELLWLWGGRGRNHSHITGNITRLLQTEDPTTSTETHSSTLTFKPSAALHGGSVTCRVRFSGGASTQETATLNVTYVKEVQTSGETDVKEGETLNLTCSVESFPPSRVVWSKYPEGDDTFTVLEEGEREVSSFVIPNVTARDSGQYVCTATHLNNIQTRTVNVSIIYKRDLEITGVRAVKEGDALNLTCSLESYPPSLIMWSKVGLNATLHNDTASASLIIPNVTLGDSGQYVCKAQHVDTTDTVSADVAVTWFSKIQTGSSRCVLESEVLTCVCVSEGFPLPSVRWPLVEKLPEYSILTTVSNHSVNSTVSLTARGHSDSTVQCVSGNENGEAKENIAIQIKSSIKEDPSTLTGVFTLEVLLAFLLGVLLSAVIWWMAITCHRRKPISGGLDEAEELMTNGDASQIGKGQPVEEFHTYDPEKPENAAVAAKKRLTPELPDGSRDVEYASIDLSLLRRRSRSEAAGEQDSRTEYAEIKKEVKEQRDVHGPEEREGLEGKEEEGVMEEEEEEEEVEAVYSNVKEIMDEI